MAKRNLGPVPNDAADPTARRHVVLADYLSQVRVDAGDKRDV
jgi:hypothetical protein